MLYLEDIKMGDHFISGEYEMISKEIKQFAHAQDLQVFHTDEDQAKALPLFQGAYVCRDHAFMDECFPVAYGLIGSESNLHSPRPTRPGDKVHVEVEIIAIRPSKTKTDRAILSYVTQAWNQNHDVLLMSATKIMVFKK